MDKLKLISGVKLTPLDIISQPMGDVFHGIKKSDDGYNGFEEAYFSTIYFGVIKPWKKHIKMTLNIIVPIGEIRFVLYDDREGSATNGKFMDINLSINNYCRLTVPPNIWMAFEGISEKTNLLMNISNLEHDPNEVVREKINKYDYNW
ncbi:dTDP-4-dehydrorhamnose 3,5-epimerase [Lutibacter sp. Hel_I_33_5]|uniref:dTDP-4-dehydrorhamnose 3,5-epimerase family protein n=1 Tax=Lutibacter sp. Hel_I_33_5 TaxID=1566289 RepID=UPI0011A71F06|nr:dTDP-4-dehydrorhamnose 3,5-epimerase family protein [Lutibacter sp. Hel_I_33_5]TVZ55491.1 dTDP-4-dehydrorhamnose 3,5-epimerase [Lutibacter sp. Hel_I_33_5]